MLTLPQHTVSLLCHLSDPGDEDTNDTNARLRAQLDRVPVPSMTCAGHDAKDYTMPCYKATAIIVNGRPYCVDHGFPAVYEQFSPEATAADNREEGAARNLEEVQSPAPTQELPTCTECGSPTYVVVEWRVGKKGKLHFNGVVSGGESNYTDAITRRIRLDHARPGGVLYTVLRTTRVKGER